MKEEGTLYIVAYDCVDVTNGDVTNGVLGVFGDAKQAAAAAQDWQRSVARDDLALGFDRHIYWEEVSSYDYWEGVTRLEAV